MSYKKRKWLQGCSMALISISTLAGAQARVDLIAIHGKIWTENARTPEAEAVAVLGGRIVAVGSSEEIEKLAGQGTRTLDLHGRRVVPGFNDAHVHFFWGGHSLTGVHLTDATSKQEFRRRIAEYVRTRPAGEWIENGNWDEQKWSPA
jgi:hypothetical protein